MAFVELDRVFIHLLDDLSVFVTVREFGAASAPTVVDGDVRLYAGGRRRVVRRKGRRQDVALSFECERATAETLADWAGRSVMYRDPVGRLIFGVYFELDQSEIDGGDYVAVSFTVQQISHDVTV